MEQKSHKGKASTQSPSYTGKWKVTSTDKSSGSVMDTERPMNGPYDRLIGPQSQTGFGLDKKD